MRFEFGQEAWTTIEEGEKNCYLLTNGLGGYQSLSLIGAVARGDQAWLMTAKRAPNVRFHMITNLYETLWVDGAPYVLLSQRMAGDAQDFEGFRFLTEFVYDGYPSWTYRVGDVDVRRTTVMAHGGNTAAVRYEITKPEGRNVSLSVKPLLRMTPKNTAFKKEDIWDIAVQDGTQPYIQKDGDLLYVSTNGSVLKREAELFGPMYFSQDERDGREASGYAVINHEVLFQAEQEFTVLECVYGTEPYTCRKGSFEELFQAHLDYEKALLERAPLASVLGKQLVLSADAYVVARESTNGKSILAGFPFFEDWGRDTMISLPGITMLTGRFDDCRSILQTFAKYVKNGLLPNLFPEGTECPMYNSVDAPLLFINAVYEYAMLSGDREFVKETFPVLAGIIEAYKAGTDFHIGMDADGLILAGAGLEQLTWMDVRVGDFLPTPRHGKPVEVNAYWYSALRAMEQFAKEFAASGTEQEASAACNAEYEHLAAVYAGLAAHAKESFLAKFWNADEGCLKDVLSGTAEEGQIRCNQIWALTQPFTMLDKEQEEGILKKVRSELYTAIGLRTLSPRDAAFHGIYIGPMEQRDRAYHQGTVWAFPLGAYYRACLRYIRGQKGEQRKEWTEHVRQGMEALQDWLWEGCIGQIAEIYDGGRPTVSRGCFAQAWSVGELLRAVWEWEQFGSHFYGSAD